MLEVRNLHVEIDGKTILDGLTLTVRPGEVAAIMGPNGSGKSTLSYVIAGRADYDVTGGEVLIDGENILEIDPEERAAKGIFLAFQYPVEIPGRRHHDVPQGLAQRPAPGGAARASCRRPTSCAWCARPPPSSKSIPT